MKSISSICLVALTLSVVASAQCEMNDATGSLTSNAVDPFGTTIVVDVNGSVDLDVDGIPLAGVLLVAGNRVSGTAACFPIGDGQTFDLASDGSAVVVGNGLGGSPAGVIPPPLMFTNANGRLSLSFGASPTAVGLVFGFQAAVFDPAQVFQINFTAAAEFVISNNPPVCQQTDDAVMSYPIPSGSTTIYGQTFSTLDFSTNGWIKFGGGSTDSDLSESADDFVQGILGGNTGGPALSILWEDLDFGNRASQQICMSEPIPGVIVNNMVDADYFSSTAFGNVVTTIDTTGGAAVIAIDFTGYTLASPPTEGLVGVSAGDSANATANSHDMHDNVGNPGNVNPFTPVNAIETVFQNFDGSYGALTTPIPSEPFDLAGLIVNIIDASGLGAMAIF